MSDENNLRTEIKISSEVTSDGAINTLRKILKDEHDEYPQDQFKMFKEVEFQWVIDGLSFLHSGDKQRRKDFLEQREQIEERTQYVDGEMSRIKDDLKALASFTDELRNLKDMRKHWGQRALWARISYFFTIIAAIALIAIPGFFFVQEVALPAIKKVEINEKKHAKLVNDLSKLESKKIDTLNLQSNHDFTSESYKKLETSVSQLNKQIVDKQAQIDNFATYDLSKHLPYTLFILPAFLGLWVARIVLNQAYRFREVADDASERKTMINTYLHLVSDGTSQITKEEREMILKPIFTLSSHPTAVDDGAPIAIIEKIAERSGAGG